MKAKDIMITDVPAVSASMPAVEALRLLRENHPDTGCPDATPGLIVLNDHGELEGIFSPLSVIKALLDCSERTPPPAEITGDYYAELCSFLKEKRVEEIMDWQPVFVTEEASLMEVAYLFVSNRFQRIPVVRKNKVIGIIYRSRLLFAMAGSIL